MLQEYHSTISSYLVGVAVIRGELG